MLEFFFKYHRKNFKKKTGKLTLELNKILSSEGITILSTSLDTISSEYKALLEEELYRETNDLYYTIRSTNGIRHPLIKRYLPESKKEINTDFNFVDLFCGAGGLSQGFINAGFKPVFVNDMYTDALETYYFNHDLHLSRIFNGSVQTLIDDFIDYEPFFNNVRLIIGGPPCQGYSKANRHRNGFNDDTNDRRFIHDKRNILYKYFVKLIGRIKPDFFVMENVTGILRYQTQIEEDIQQETSQRYYFIPLSLDAQNFNIPQSRKRYFLIGGKDHNSVHQIMSNIHRQIKPTSRYKLADALFGLPIIKTNPFIRKPDFESDVHGFNIEYNNLQQNDYLREINKGVKIPYLLNHRSRYNNDNDLSIFRLLPEGENSLHCSIQHLNNYSNRNHIFKDKYYKLKSDDVSKTITSHMKYDCHMYIHPTQPRGISPREAARIQTFPDDYFFRGTLNSWYNQIGNAVPVKLAEIIGNEIMRFCR